MLTIAIAAILILVVAILVVRVRFSRIMTTMRCCVAPAAVVWTRAPSIMRTAAVMGAAAVLRICRGAERDQAKCHQENVLFHGFSPP